jgi:hypothetical protein
MSSSIDINKNKANTQRVKRRKTDDEINTDIINNHINRLKIAKLKEDQKLRNHIANLKKDEIKMKLMTTIILPSDDDE